MDPCDHCEAVMQPYLDRTLSVEEQVSVEQHLAGCTWCSKRFRFEAELRGYVRVACTEPMAPELKEKLAALRTPLI
jgi:predicted anti-sigma-YlaC factor YlaD